MREKAQPTILQRREIEKYLSALRPCNNPILLQIMQVDAGSKLAAFKVRESTDFLSIIICEDDWDGVGK